MAKLKLGVLLLLVMLTAACGWQLRGAAGGGFAGVPIALEGAAGNRLLNEIAVELRSLDANVVASAAQAEWVVSVSAPDRSRRTVATDAQGFASEYELRYRLSFVLRPGGLADAEALGAERQSVQTSAAYPANTDDLQAQEAEEEALTRELREDAIRLLLARIGRRL